ncbi:MAG: CBS domain-containing protein [Myxococcales bacterium]|nr:CBS domain-containing protein [Myxococcales bacterium]
MKTIRELLQTKGHKVHTVQAGETVYRAIEKMVEHNIGALLVKREERVIGIITERDYLKKVILKNRSSKETSVETIMSPELVVTNSARTIGEALATMTEKRCRHLPVLEDGKLCGLVSIGDLVKAMIADQKAHIEFLEEYLYGGR